MKSVLLTNVANPVIYQRIEVVSLLYILLLASENFSSLYCGVLYMVPILLSTPLGFSCYFIAVLNLREVNSLSCPMEIITCLFRSQVLHCCNTAVTPLEMFCIAMLSQGRHLNTSLRPFGDQLLLFLFQLPTAHGLSARELSNDIGRHIGRCCLFFTNCAYGNWSLMGRNLTSMFFVRSLHIRFYATDMDPRFSANMTIGRYSSSRNSRCSHFNRSISLLHMKLRHIQPEKFIAPLLVPPYFSKILLHCQIEKHNR